jgi:8-oxo-dGTP pyrophosphatase MutT (NUDIX family)
MRETKSAGGVVINNDRVLVVNQKGTSWSLPKGHVEDGEDKITAARREIYEESGIKELKLIEKLGDYQRHRISKDGGDDLSELKTIFMFLFNTDIEELKPIDPENPEARWVEKGKVVELLTHSKDKGFFESVLDKI